MRMVRINLNEVSLAALAISLFAVGVGIVKLSSGENCGLFSSAFDGYIAPLCTGQWKCISSIVIQHLIGYSCCAFGILISWVKLYNLFGGRYVRQDSETPPPRGGILSRNFRRQN